MNSLLDIACPAARKADSIRLFPHAFNYSWLSLARYQ
jgi:hypothetical protein